MGPSGAGKDSLIEAARTRLVADNRFVFPTRVITRPSDVNSEAHATMTDAEFDLVRRQGYFGLSWQAHGLWYGIPAGDLEALHFGSTVVVNVSRGVIRAAELRCRNVVVINVTAPVPVLAERIARRGRESKEDIELRLAREAPLNIVSARMVEVANDHDFKSAAEQFIKEVLAAHFRSAECA